MPAGMTIMNIAATKHKQTPTYVAHKRTFGVGGTFLSSLADARCENNAQIHSMTSIRPQTSNAISLHNHDGCRIFGAIMINNIDTPNKIGGRDNFLSLDINTCINDILVCSLGCRICDRPCY